MGMIIRSALAVACALCMGCPSSSSGSTPREFPAFTLLPLPEAIPHITAATVSAKQGVLYGRSVGDQVIHFSLDRGNTWQEYTMSSGVNDHVVPLVDGTALVLARGDLIIVDPAAGTQKTLPRPPGYKTLESVTVSSDGRIFTIPDTADLRRAHVLMPGATAWQRLPDLDLSEGYRLITAAPDGTVWVKGAGTLRTLSPDSMSYATTVINNRIGALTITSNGTLLEFNAPAMRRSEDGGQSWTESLDNVMGGRKIIEHDGTLYFGVHRSIDDAKTWTKKQHELFYVDAMGSYAWDLAYELVVELDAAETPMRVFGGSFGTQILHSGAWPGRDGAVHLTVGPVSSSVDTAVLFLTWNPAAGSWDFPTYEPLPTPGGVVFTPSAGGVHITEGRTLHRSDDGGETWTQVADMSTHLANATSFVEDPSNGDWYLNTVRLSMGNNDRFALRSSDQGLTWAGVAFTVETISRDGVLYGSAPSPTTGFPGRTFSEDGGATWQDQNERTVNAISPTSGLHVRTLGQNMEVSSGPLGPWTLLENMDPDATSLRQVWFDHVGHLWHPFTAPNSLVQQLARSVSPL